LFDDLISEDLQEFIFRHIDSIAQLEALLLLRKNREESWTAERIAQRLYTSEAESSRVLERLCADGLLSFEKGHYRIADETEELRQMVGRLAEVYARHLIPVTNLIHSKPRRLREFSDAFKIRKERP
jgi:Mn-dependent DtxR family transcriptional regulator